jgi:hypothetical protein
MSFSSKTQDAKRCRFRVRGGVAAQAEEKTANNS